MSPWQDIVLHKSEATENTHYFIIHGVATLNFNRKSENIRKQPPPLAETNEADQGVLIVDQDEG